MIVAALCLVVVAAIAGGTIVGVVALNAQRDALEVAQAERASDAVNAANMLRELAGTFERRAADEAARAEARDQRAADERHVLADRLQHPEIARPFRQPPVPPKMVEPTGSYPGSDLSDLTDAELIEEFGKDFLNAES